MDDGYYFIRPMHKLDYGLYIDNGDVKLTYIGTSNTLASAPEKARWTIEYIDGGYVFKCAGSNVRTLQPFAGVASNNSIVNATLYDSTAEYQKWSANPITPVPEGVLLYDVVTGVIVESIKHIALGQTKQLSDLGILPAVYSLATLDQTVEWESQYPAMVDVNEHTGAITGEGLTGGNQNYAVITAISPHCSAAGSYQVQCSDNEFFGVQNYFDEDTFRYMQSPPLVEYIPNAVRFVDVAYYNLFGITFHSDADPTKDRISGIVACNANGICSANYGCQSNCKDHHKNVTRIYEVYRENIARCNNEITVFWTNYPGGVYCDNPAYSCVADGSMASVKNYYPFIHVKWLAGDNWGELEACMAITLAHETADQHPGYVENNGGCVMDQYNIQDTSAMREFYLDVISGRKFAFCESCRNILENYANEEQLNFWDWVS